MVSTWIESEEIQALYESSDVLRTIVQRLKDGPISCKCKRVSIEPNAYVPSETTKLQFGSFVNTMLKDDWMPVAKVMATDPLMNYGGNCEDLDYLVYALGRYVCPSNQKNTVLLKRVVPIFLQNLVKKYQEENGLNEYESRVLQYQRYMEEENHIDNLSEEKSCSAFDMIPLFGSLVASRLNLIYNMNQQIGLQRMDAFIKSVNTGDFNRAMKALDIDMTLTDGVLSADRNTIEQLVNDYRSIQDNNQYVVLKNRKKEPMVIKIRRLLGRI